MKNYPSRQIHMDFHTSPDIPDIGSLFDGDEFGLTLRAADVELVNLFGKCHHGYYYYPSKIGIQHPGLSFNLLQSQIDACKKYGIEYTVYTCVGWNEYWATTHPEWQEISPEGLLGGKSPFSRQYYQWKKLCLNNRQYRELLKREFSEMAETFHPKGLWIDIILQNQCVCQSCLQLMASHKLNPQLAQDRERCARIVQIDFQKEMFGYIKKINKDLHVYFNGYSYGMDLKDDPEISNTQKLKYNTYMDIESLPSAEWGYTHFPVSVNYLNKYDNKEITMMNGKFHTSWGDFGSLRNKEALEYEAFRALAYGAGVCTGDQLHPSGKIDTEVYTRIGDVFRSIKEKEPWCLNSKKTAQIGVYGTIKSSDNITSSVDRAAEGTYRILQELKYQFDFLDLTDPVDSYDLLILPDKVKISQAAAKKIDSYVEKGGAVLITGFSAISDTGEFMLESVGAEYDGQADYCPRYIRLGDKFDKIPKIDYVTTEIGVKIRAKEGAETLAFTVNPYFNRSEAHFCSHRQTPPMVGASNEPSIVKTGNVIYSSSSLFTDFAENGVKVYKDIIGHLITMLIDKPFVRSDLPANAEVIIRENIYGRRSTIVHILNYIIQRKCQSLDTIEDVIPMYSKHLEIRCKTCPSAVYVLPQMEKLDFTFDSDYAAFIVPEIKGHTMLEIVYE